ncbi:MAG: C4-dicarboxylate ABC transporter [Proteobacteria bacterium]|nr:MAG: C4-dicarboxylate ABC transporter [Pseudomonadota bacterium]
MNANSRLGHFPVSFFAVVMGLSGLTIAWEKAAVTLRMPHIVGTALLFAMVASFVIVSVLYATKLLRFPGAVVEELHHPVKISFFPAFSISLILLSICILPASQSIASILLVAGAVLHLAMTLYVMNAWMHHERFRIEHINPAWFIPVVGNILVPIAGAPLGFTELSWFFFSIGLIFWLVLLTIFFYRITFHQPLPGRLLPTLFILIAPPAVGFISYIRLTDSLDVFARVLFYTALFLTLVLFSQAVRFARIPFFLSWWAYSFPLAAFTVATQIMYELTGATVFRLLGYTMLAIASLVVALLVVRTVFAIRDREVCVEE